MLKTLSSLAPIFNNKIGLSIIENNQGLLNKSGLSPFKIPCRTTIILKRKHPVKLIKQHLNQEEWKFTKKRFNVFEIDECTDELSCNEIEVILNSFIPGVGEKNDVIKVKRNYAYYQLLLPGLAEYATPEALEKLKNKKTDVDEIEKVTQPQFSGLFVSRTMNVLSSLIISVTMSKENKWVLEPWHIRASFRKAGVHLNEDCIEMPKKKIEGPDMNLEAKEFLVTVIINKRERVKVRCRIHHWSTDIIHRLAPTPQHWTQRVEPLFEEEAEELNNMPIPPVPKSKAKSLN